MLVAAAAARALEFWSAFDLQKKRAEWDEIGLKIAKAQEVCYLTRSLLVSLVHLKYLK